MYHFYKPNMRCFMILDTITAVPEILYSDILTQITHWLRCSAANITAQQNITYVAYEYA